jgi:hypothetical protein
MRSTASVAIITAVSKPKVWSVPLMSLSMVLGTPTLGTPFSLRNSVTDCVSSPPRAISASILLAFRTSWTFSMPPGIFFTLVREECRMVPPVNWMPSVRPPG